MVKIGKQHLTTLAGIALGSLAGFAWYFWVGCSTGTCPITSNPWTSTLYGAVMGGLAFSSLAGKQEINKPS